MSTSYSNSNLGKYGYDLVVGTTQLSLNAILLEFIAGINEPTVTACYVYDSSTESVCAIDYNTLVQKANGTDPFSVPNDSDPKTDQDLQNLINVQFVGAFRATLGLPSGVDPADLPDLVTLCANSSKVTFNLLCSEFNVVGFSGLVYNPTWLNQSQPSQGPYWIFASNVDLCLSSVSEAAYQNLPPAVQQAIKNLSGSAFSVQQLLFDLDNAGLWSTPTIPNIQPSTALYNLLQSYFIGQYFSQMQSSGQPLLGVNVVQQTPSNASLGLTDLNLWVSPYVDPNGQPYPNPTAEQQQMATLNYLCATDNHALPPAESFAWNWVDLADQSNFDGVVSVNRNDFAAYLMAPISEFAAQFCIQPEPTITLSNPVPPYGETTPEFGCTFANNQAPTVAPNWTGSNVLNITYASQPRDLTLDFYNVGSPAKLSMSSTYSINMEFMGKQVIIKQEQVCGMSISTGNGSATGNLVDTTITDTYSLFTDEHGNLGCNCNTQTSDNPTFPPINSFLNLFSGINEIANNIKTAFQNLQGGQLTDVPLAPFQNFVFPGGSTFAFKDVQFSNNQDLVTPITYQDPSGPVAVMPKPKSKTSGKEMDIPSIYKVN